MKSGSMQFAWMTRAEARAKFEQMGPSALDGDRIIAQRRGFMPVTTPSERLAARRYNQANGCDARGRPSWWRDRDAT